jgi:hypothetical protein
MRVDESNSFAVSAPDESVPVERGLARIVKIEEG